jgi:N-methylhydantoinase B
VTVPAIDAFSAEILRSYLVSTVREMVATTTRTAYSTCFAHGEDFTCALLDAQGRMIAQDQGVPVHAGSLGHAVQHIIAGAGQIAEGDVFVHNDPYNWGTHQADGLVCRPIFADGTLLGFAANRGHWSDVGGMAPGGWSGAATDVIQEGLMVPAVRLMRAGVLQEDIRRLLERNVRLPVQLWGDVSAQIASNIVAERRVRALVDRYGVAGFEAAIDAALTYSQRRLAAGLERIGDGRAEASDFIEDDASGNGPFEIRVAVEKRGAHVRFDFTGTVDQVAGPVNCTLACTGAAVVTALIAVVDSEIPLNQGVLDSIEITAPEGCLVNPVFPAPTFGATADPADRVIETVLRALGRLVPDRVLAGSYSTGNNVTGGGVGADGRPFLWYSYQSGGCGARPAKDGNSAEWHLMANSKNESMEVWESRYPVEFLSYELVRDSAGAGRTRGGLGTERRLRVLSDTSLSGTADHHRHGARGVDGGRPGIPNRFLIVREGVESPIEEVFDLPSPSKFANLRLRPGDVFVSRQGGGGGYGDPAERPPAAVRADVEAGYIGAAAAAADYGRRGSTATREASADQFDAGSAPWTKLIGEEERAVIARGRYGMDSSLGRRPALLLIDVQPSVVGLDRPILEQIDEYPSGIGAVAHRAVAILARLAATARAADVPVIYTRLVTRDGVGMYGERIDREPIDDGDPRAQIVPELTPQPADVVLDKHMPSAFFGTPLSLVLSRRAIDTLLIGGGSTSGCVRATAVDASSHGYHVGIVEDGTFDRIALSHAASLLDIWMKYGTVLRAQEAARYLTSLDNRRDPA